MILHDIEKRIVNSLINRAKEKEGNNLINIHRLETENSGDLMCAPYLYFDKLKDNSSYNVDILEYLSKNIAKSFKWVNKIKNSNIIVGGGGLLDRPTFNHAIETFALLHQKNRKVVLWGVGHNNATRAVSEKYYEQIKSFKLVGVRDYEVKGIDWVPCVSCMNKIFDNSYEIIRETGIIEHEHIPIKGANTFNIETLTNRASFNEIVDFIGQSETIITNSYHVMYWSILMQRKVLVIPNSSKMHSFKYKIPFLNSIDEYKLQQKKAEIYTEALDVCREKNLLFSEKVFDYLKL